MTAIGAETIAALSRTSTATLATQLFRRGLRNQFLAGLAPLNPAAASFVGTAFTLRYIPSREDLDVVGVFQDERHPQRRAIEEVGPGEVLVIDARSYTRTGSIGSILASRVQHRGAVGVVTDGSVRDSTEIRAMTLPVYTGGVSAGLSLSGHHAVDVQVPIGCAGVPVFPGDVLVGDGEGVVCIPRHLADEVAVDGLRQEETEAFVLERIRGGASIFGNYPPSQETLEAFERSRGSG
jgi:regulator of RNase E activity RraA